MFMLNIILFLTGIAFFVFGFLICFKKKYVLVNGFSPKEHRSERDTAYADQIGLIELMSGMLYIFSSIVGLMSESIIASLVLLVVCVSLTAIFMLISTVKTRVGR